MRPKILPDSQGMPRPLRRDSLAVLSFGACEVRAPNERGGKIPRLRGSTIAHHPEHQRMGSGSNWHSDEKTTIARQFEEIWMRRAIVLAEKGGFRVSPNPKVGACVVRNGKCVGAGYHAEYGGDHAEVRALRQAGRKSLGATLYVTLEPCAHWGKTPPCVKAIVDAGIREVVIAALDPNRSNHAQGVRLLRKHGIRVRAGILSDEAEKQIEAFSKWIRTGLPFVTLKMAQSLDGKIATVTGKSRWITSPASRNFVHDLRAESDAVLVGKNTLLLDNPRLTTHLDSRLTLPGKPWRIVLDPKSEAPASLQVFQGKTVTIRVVAESFLSKAKKSKTRSGALLAVRDQKGRLDFRDLLKKLGGLGVSKLLVEGGGETAWSFLESGLVDRVLWMIAPIFLGGRTAKTSVEGMGIKECDKAFRYKIVRTLRLGDDLLLEARKV